MRDLEQGRTSRPRRGTIGTVAQALGLDAGQVAGAAAGPHDRRERAARVRQVTGGIRLGMLGPLAVWRDRTPAEPGPGQQRAVLGLLALYAGSAVHREAIIDAVWGDRPPASAVAMVQSYASRLRRLLGERTLVSDGTSYRLAMTGSQLDALEFAGLAARARRASSAGDHPEACTIFERAFRLWRGKPLADVTRLREHPAVTDLIHNRTEAARDYADAAMAMGRPERALPLLRALTAADPLDERLHARLMLALAGAGRQAAALAVFGALRRRLDEELGIVPGAELADAHLRVLRGDLPGHGSPAADGSRRRHRLGRHVPRQLPPAVANFAGRSGELTALSELLEGADAGPAGTVPICVIGGMPGVGKTALAVHWAHRAAAAFPDGQLFVNLRGFDPSGAPAAPAEVVRAFLDALGVPAERIPPDQDARAGLYRSLLANRKMLIVLDNARDEQQVRPLLPASPGCLVLVTSRSRLTGLAATNDARPLTLDVLPGADARRLLAARLGSAGATAEPGAIGQITGLCADLPLALTVAAARAAAHPGRPLGALSAELADPRTRLDALDTGENATSVRMIFAGSYRRLADPAATMFRLLGVHPGPDVSAEAAASLAGVPLPNARRALAELTRAHLLTEHGPGRFTLHALVRAYAADQAADSERSAAIGRALDHYLHTARRAAALLNPSQDPYTLARSGVRPEHLADHRQALAWFRAERRVLLAVADLARDDPRARHLSLAVADCLDRSRTGDERRRLQQGPRAHPGIVG